MAASSTTPARPLVGEPVALDLLNTRWIAGSADRDLLETLDGLRRWLDDVDLTGRCPADLPTLANLVHTREILDRLVDTPGNPEAAEALNAVLAHGLVRRSLRSGGPEETVEFDHPSWAAAWTAADNYLTLLAEHPDRIRRCANPACVLRFLDTSKNGTRRWCSMATCGNRAKAARHHARARGGRAVRTAVPGGRDRGNGEVLRETGRP
ncbi:CGNR zinc finger domain-containing protein [Thermobifida halotolerans]|uniref:CGNR zinc finger domain-containing protein n=1 Tax=Thermobifida halotolerans TaxID=483545 RepID=A0AA97M2X4_9ACTN|nr:CGNR zinc finger domain-containing protein [Thermobifida halotolerans]UOE18554.1 CGNR zinc finger domain-containing protein [Thermobifida halotolerans]